MCARVTVVLSLFVWFDQFTLAQPPTLAERDQNMSRQVQASVKAIKLFAQPSLTDELEVVEAYKWANTARKPSGDRLCLLYLHQGRPVASCKIYPTFRNIVMTPISFTDLEIVARRDGRTVWSPPNSALEFRKLADAGAPGPTAAKRRIQMKLLARDFSGKTAQDEAKRQKSTPILRLLPTPIYRYSNSAKLEAQGIIDGSVFAFVVEGGNPQVLMVLEAARDKSNSMAYWRVGFTRRTFSELHVDHRDNEIWKAPAFPISEMNANNYFHKISLPLPSSQVNSKPRPLG